MKFWRELVNSGSLGTAKTPVKWNQLPTYLQEQVESLVNLDAEEEFLTLASLSYQYRNGGFVPGEIKEEKVPTAESENLPYASSASTHIFKLILSEDLPALTGIWVERCKEKRLIAEPEILPELLDLGLRKKEFRQHIKAIIGKRGEWLAKLNPDWQVYLVPEDVDALWQTGTPDQRKELLKDLRQREPAKAIILLKSTWETEGANEKATFLEILRNNLSGDDLEWLESLKEKSQKVTALILDLLKTVSGSTTIEKYWAALKDHIRIKSGKALLGMINKTSIDIDENFSIPDELFKTGIEKLSSDKNISDHQHIVSQLIAAIPPSYWNKHFNEAPRAIIELFQKEKQTAFYIQAIAQASVRFKDSQWLEELLSNAKMDLILNLLPLMIRSLPNPKCQEFAIKFFAENPQEIMAAMGEQNEEWSISLAKAILKFTSSEVFAYNRSFYRPAIAFIPIAMLGELDSFTPSEEQKRTYWSTQAEEIKRLLELKKQIIQSI